MIYLIGGCARTGKSTLAQLLCQRLAIGWSSTDVVSELANIADPKVGYTSTVDPEQTVSQADRFYPYLEHLAKAMTTISGDYIIEGVEFHPLHAERLGRDLEVRAVFLGWSAVTIESIDLHAEVDRWTEGLDESLRARLPGALVELSAFVERECARLGIPYVDMADNFSSSLQRALAILVDRSVGARR